MSNNSHTFDINKFVFTFGSVVVSGFAPGTFVDIAFDAPLYVETQGTDGEVCRVLRNKYMATITLSLMQSSKINDALTASMLADVAGNIQEPFTIKDMNGTTIGIATQCWISQLPKTAFADESVPREWIIKAAKLDLTVGGNFA
jgi:hypothetical protein